MRRLDASSFCMLRQGLQHNPAELARIKKEITAKAPSKSTLKPLEMKDQKLAKAAELIRSLIASTEFRQQHVQVAWFASRKNECVSDGTTKATQFYNNVDVKDAFLQSLSHQRIELRDNSSAESLALWDAKWTSASALEDKRSLFRQFFKPRIERFTSNGTAKRWSSDVVSVLNWPSQIPLQDPSHYDRQQLECIWQQRDAIVFMPKQPFSNTTYDLTHTLRMSIKNLIESLELHLSGLPSSPSSSSSSTSSSSPSVSANLTLEQSRQDLTRLKRVYDIVPHLLSLSSDQFDALMSLKA